MHLDEVPDLFHADDPHGLRFPYWEQRVKVQAGSFIPELTELTYTGAEIEETN